MEATDTVSPVISAPALGETNQRASWVYFSRRPVSGVLDREAKGLPFSKAKLNEQIRAFQVPAFELLF